MNEITCPACNTDEHLYGTPDGDTIHITCTACELSWDRLTRPHCARCASLDMVCVPEVLVERSRGTQMSIMGIQPHYLCRVCDAEELAKPRHGHLPNTLGGHNLSERP
jgi:hypothetical protein